MPISGTLAICSSCHGYDGLGRPESGIDPSNITWSHLTKSYGHIHNGSKHPPFTEKKLKHFIQSGIYPGGQKANPEMPIYAMAQADLDALVAFMKKLGTLRDPGLDRSIIRIGTLLPAEGPLASNAVSMRAVMENYFEQVNRNGGVFGRRIKLIVRRFDPEAESLSTLRKWFIESELFALLSPFVPKGEVLFKEAIEPFDIPVIGPYTLYPPLDFRENRTTFLLQPGIYHQLKTLKGFVEKHGDVPRPKVAILYDDSAENRRVMTQLQNEWNRTDWQPFLIKKIERQRELLRQNLMEMSEAEINVVVYAGYSDELQQILSYRASSNWQPLILASGNLVGDVMLNISEEMLPLLYIAFPSLPQDRNAAAVAKLAQLIDVEQVGPKDIRAMTSCYVASELVLKALHESGRNLDREKFLSALEQTYKFKTGLMPPITFTRNRRVGTDGIYIMGLGEKASKPDRGIMIQWFQTDK
ncbi:MAG: ABC transporter substrate-binding protein [Deltaproteobacteria bacterium]|nr:ABC transporter substrate-binding protein [Deltaproteobacteria bacterium]